MGANTGGLSRLGILKGIEFLKLNCHSHTFACAKPQFLFSIADLQYGFPQQEAFLADRLGDHIGLKLQFESFELRSLNSWKSQLGPTPCEASSQIVFHIE